MHLLAAICSAITLSALPLLCVELGLALSAYAYSRSLWPDAKRAHSSIEFREEYLRLSSTHTTAVEARIECAAAHSHWWAWLCARDDAGRSRMLLIAADALEPAAFRRLRVWLRWHPSINARSAQRNGLN
jgi:hypothetical protein